MNIIITISENKNISMEVEPNTTIDKIKEFIKKSENINYGRQILSFNDRVLSEDKQIKDYNIVDNSTIVLKIKN